MFEPHAATTVPDRAGRWRAAIAGALTALLAAAALAVPARAAAPQFTPLAATVLAAPEPVRGSDGRTHVVYEILLQNDAGVAVDVQSLTVRANPGGTLRSFSEPQLPAIMSTFSNAPTSSLAPETAGKLWLDLALAPGARIPRALVHRISARVTLPNTQPRTFVYDTARTRVSRRRALAIAAPLHGGPFLNFNGCCGLSPHRTALPAVDGTFFLSQRFATDYIRIDAQGRGGAGDLTRNESFFTFGEPVYAVAGARVVSTRNDLPENVPLNEPPGSSFTPATTLGNHVVLRLRGGRYALYAHLQRGSVRVRPGQRVRAGQVLARVGNTGQSGGAHLHFQLTGGPSPTASNGVPYVLNRFTLTGTVTNIDQFLTGAANAEVRPLQPASARRGQLPLHATVVRFPS
jgi:murein DD-endopeptidase MepM/ murein hydrolase activator NlpD